MEGEIRNGGNYDPVRYKDWRYPKTARNEREKRPPKPVEGHVGPNNESSVTTSNTKSAQEKGKGDGINGDKRAQDLEDDEWDQEFDNLPARHLRPRYLCFLAPGGYQVRSVKEEIKTRGKTVDLQYVFVSYTRMHFDIHHQVGAKAIADIGIKAARKANVPAFWLDFECTPVATRDEDIHRICDVIRGAHSMVIAVRNTENNVSNDPDFPLQEWGSRIWTLPELLLCPTEHRIEVYTNGSQEPPESVAKRNFAIRAWEDSKAVRQLIDHYEGSLSLTPLELVTIALQCIQDRLEKMRRAPEYKVWADGDMSYALMGLLRRRPKVDQLDTDFEAFARLSLANDSNLLLERLICMLPPKRGQRWNKIEDAWGVRLWDIYPTCQIAGIGENQTVILDGAFGATIRWKSLAQVAFIKRKTPLRTAVKILLRGVPGYFVIGVITLASGAGMPSYDRHLSPSAVFGIIFFILSLTILLLSPYLLLTTYRGKFWGTQPWFFGIEGYVPIETIEQSLFGVNLGRLRWSASGSSLSRHHEAEDDESTMEGECEAILPDIPEIPENQRGKPPPKGKLLPDKSEASQSSEEETPQSPDQTQENNRPIHDGKERLFTLVDTFSMEVTLFRAVKPPTTVMICGHEGGMQRAVLCSYDWRTQTFCRETVLRLKTTVIEKMSRVPRFRFSLLDGFRYREDVDRAPAERRRREDRMEEHRRNREESEAKKREAAEPNE